MCKIKFIVSGDMSVQAVFGSEIDEDTNRRVMNYARSLREKKIAGITDICPSYRSVEIFYDPLAVSPKKLLRRLKKIGAEPRAGAEKALLWKIPVCYGGSFGEDLSSTAELLGISEDEIIRRHSGRDYRIYMLGFLPGFAYLGGMDPKISVPRLSSPRTGISPGSVGIGGAQTGIYPVASPGGWRLIGRTPLRLYDIGREPAVMYSAGDYIRFVPIGAEEYRRIEALAAADEYVCEKEQIQFKAGD